MAGLALGEIALASFNFQTYQNRNSPDFTFLDSTRSGDEITLNPMSHSAIYQYFYNPIGFDRQEDGHGTLVPSLQSLNLTSEYNFSKTWSIGLEMPVHQLNFDQRGYQFAFGDLRFFSKITLFEKDREDWKIALVPSLYLPTGNPDLLLSNSDGGAGTNLVLEKKDGPIVKVLNFGFDYFPKASFRNINYELQTSLGAGFKYEMSKEWSIETEWMGRQTSNIRTGDLYLGGQYIISPHQASFFGASLASTQLDSSNLEYRLMIGFRWTSPLAKILTRKIENRIETIKKYETIHDCGPRIYAKHFIGRPLTEEEKHRFIEGELLPYKSTPANHLHTLRLGGKTGFTKDGFPYVKDAQVLFAVDLKDLPSRESVISVKAFDLNLTATKFWSRDDTRTDMLCLINQKICSGDVSRKGRMADHLNTAFSEGKEPPNDFFLQQILAAERRGQISVLRLGLPIDRLMENSTLSNSLQVIYQDSKTLYFAVAHDIFVAQDVELNLEFSVQECAETTFQSGVEIHAAPPKVDESESPISP